MPDEQCGLDRTGRPARHVSGARAQLAGHLATGHNQRGMPSGRLRDQWNDLGLEKKLGVVVVPLVVAAVTVGVPLLAGHGGPPEPKPKLELVDLAVRSGDSGRLIRIRRNHDPEFTPFKPPRADITVVNSGKLVSVVKRIDFNVVDSGLVRICQGGGGLEPSKNYKVLLPPSPHRSDSIRFKVSQQVPPGRADRFTVSFDVPEPARQEGDRLYALDVLVYHDTAGRPIRAGRILIAAPLDPDTRYFDRVQRPCSTHNEQVFRRLFAVRATRAPNLTLAVLRCTRAGVPCRTRGTADQGP